MPKSMHSLSLSESRSQLFVQLAAMEKAGLPVERALQIACASAAPSVQLPLERTLAGLARHRPLPAAAEAAKLFEPWEAALIHAATESGQLAAMYQYLARHYERIATRARQLKSRMALPVAVLLIGLFVSPLPAVVRGEMSAVGYLAHTLLPIALGVAAFSTLRGSWQRARAQQLPPLGYTLLGRVPVLGELWQRITECRGLTILSLLLKSGLPMDKALEITAGAQSDPILRASCNDAARYASGGGDAALAINLSGLCTEPYGRELIRVGDLTGMLAENISRYTLELDERIQLQLDLIAEWAPRVLYFGAAIFFLL